MSEDTVLERAIRRLKVLFEYYQASEAWHRHGGYSPELCERLRDAREAVEQEMGGAA